MLQAGTVELKQGSVPQNPSTSTDPYNCTPFLKPFKWLITVPAHMVWASMIRMKDMFLYLYGLSNTQNNVVAQKTN